MLEHEMENSDTQNGLSDAEFLSPVSFHSVPSLLLADLTRKNAKNEPVLDFTDITVYALLKAHARCKGKCHPSHARLARLAGCSPKTIDRSLRRLDEAGHIQRKTHYKGKIFLLTDVMPGGKVVRRDRISFAPKPLKPCLMTAPEVQEPVGVTTAPAIDTEADGDLAPDDEIPF